MSNGEGGSGLNTENADKAIEGQLEGTSQLNQDFAIGVERRKEQLKIETEITKALQLQFETTRKNLDFQQEMIVQLRKQAEELAKSGASLEDQKKFLKDIRSQYNTIADDNSVSLDLQKKINAAMDAEVPDLKLIAKLMDKVRGEMEQTKDFTRDIDTNFSKFSKTLGMTDDFEKTGLGKMNEFFIDLQTGNTEKKVDMITAKFGDLTSPLNIAANLISVVVDQVFKLEQASIGFSKATGFAREFDAQIMSVAKNVTMAGGTMDDASKSLGDLAKNMSNFATLSENAMKNLATLDFRLKQIGVTNASKMFDIFSRNLGKGADEAERLTRDLILSGTAAGITASEMSANFESAFKDLAVNGSRATEVFKDLAAQAKTAGVAISDLTALGKDFDTFDKGAEKAAKLNAILGTQISHMQMLHMSDEQRSMEMIRQVKMAVGNFDALSRSEKLYVAQAIAGGDVAKAQRLINMSTAEYLAKKDQMAAAAKSQEDLRKMTEQLIPVMDQIKLVFTKFALALSPLIKQLMTVMNVFSSIVGFLGPALLPILGMIGASFYQMSSAATALGTAVNAAFIRFTALLYFAQLAEETFGSDSILTIGIRGLAIGFMFLGIATKFAGKELSLIRQVFIVIIGALSTQINPLFINFAFHMGAGFKFLGTMANMAAPKMILFGLAVGLIFGTIAYMIYGLASLVKNMTELISTLLEAPNALYSAAGGMTALAAAMGTLSLATIGFKFKAFTGFIKSISNMGDGIEKFVGSVKGLKTIAGEISSAMGDTTLVGTVDGGKSTVALGKNSAIASIFAGDKLVVDIQMPEINFPTPVVHVYIDGVAISDAVMDVVMETL